MRNDPGFSKSDISPGMSENIEFSITAEMVEDFAHLTGDRSSLHTDSVFARKSLYRETVVHGMLPVMFLWSLSSIQKCSHTLENLNARFLKPVFANDRLRLTAEVISVDELANRVEFSFRISKTVSNILVTTGNFILVPLPGSTIRFEIAPHDQNIVSMVTDDLVENNLEIQHISKDDECGLDFRLLPEHALSLKYIICSGFESPISLTTDPRYFLSLSLLSTFVGMCRPGRSATFLEFSIFFEDKIGWSESCTLKACVSFISQSTQTLVERVTISGTGGSLPAKATGKIKVRVNDRPRQMPSLDDLRENGLGLDLQGKVVLITGASRGIGETTAKLFSLHSAHVAVNYFRGKSDAERVVDEIRRGGGVAIAVQADVSDRDQVNRMVEEINLALGPVEILVNNAVRDAMSISFLNLTWQDMQQDIDVILQGAFNCCQTVIPEMIERGGGKIINLTTVYTEIPPPGQLKYVLAKSGLVGLTRSLAAEMAPHNIQVNMVSPSMVETDLAASIPKMLQERIKHEAPMNRMASSLDVARAVIFLSSSLSSFTTGQKIMVTGGHPPYL